MGTRAERAEHTERAERTCQACEAYQAYVHVLEQEILALHAELKDPARYDRTYYNRHTKLHNFAPDLVRALRNKGCSAFFVNHYGRGYLPSDVRGNEIHNNWLTLKVSVASSSGQRTRSIKCSDLIPYGMPLWHATLELFRTFVGEEPPAWFTEKYVLA
jgi:hypothetical protein